MEGTHLTLVVPLFNEEERLAERGHELVEWAASHAGGAELVLVDDGSTDRTAIVAEALAAAARRSGGPSVRLLRRPHLGKGAAVASGLMTATSLYAGFCDVDLSTPLDQFDQVLKTAERESGLAIASRGAPGSDVVTSQGAVRQWLGRQYNRLLRMTIVPGIHDTQCGAKAAPTRLWVAVLPSCQERRLAWDVEVIAAARRRGYPVVEVPVAWHHDSRSRIRVPSEGLAMVAAIPRIAVRARRDRAVPVDPPEVVDGAGAAGAFEEAQARTLLDHADHWWFRCKAAVVSDLLRRHPPVGSGLLVDIGAGNGAVTGRVVWGGRRLVVDGTPALVGVAAAQGIPAVLAEGERVPLPGGAADVVCLLDVIEHAIDPQPLLEEARRLLAAGGRLIVTVPAHSWLWSDADVFLGHQRRYHREQLSDQLHAAGFEPIVVHYVFSWLVVPVWLLRRARRVGVEAQLGLRRDDPITRSLARWLCAIEIRSLRGSWPPVGTSLVAFARRGLS